MLTKESELNDILLQRRRIQDQIKNVKRQYETERNTIIKNLRMTNSREQRQRLVIKYNNSRSGSRIGHGSPLPSMRNAG